jgi:ribosome-binding protein aMBF1 (putative translation factor)
VKLSELKSIDQVVEERRESDPEFRQAWDASAFARQIALALVRYRGERGLTQRQLAAEVDVKQSAIARWEQGENSPSIASLAKLTRATGLTFRVDFAHGSAGLVAA